MKLGFQTDRSEYMHGNVGEKYIQIKDLVIGNMYLNECGTEFEIQNYYSVPHGYSSIRYDGILLFIPDKVFEEHFITLIKYKQYYQLGDHIMINANGTFDTYSIENIDGNSHYVTLKLERC